mgnify:FL=1
MEKKSLSSKELDIHKEEVNKEKEQLEEREPSKEKEKEKSTTPEEDDKIKLVFKDESSDRSASIRESSGSNSYQNRRNSLLRKNNNSETDLDKIIAGKEETRLNSISIGISGEKDTQRKSDNRIVVNNFNIGHFLREGRIRKTMTRVERKSIFKTILEEKDKDMKFIDIIKARLNDLKENTLSFFLQIIKEFEDRYAEYINNLSDYIKTNEMKINKVFQQNEENGENMLEYAENNIFQQIENVLEIHENIFDALEDHISLLEIFLEKPDLIQQKNPLEFFINNYTSNILNSWFLNKINFQKLNVRSFETNKDLSELYSKYLIKKKDNNFSNFTITQDSKGNLSTGIDFIKKNLKNLEKLKFSKVKSTEINKIFESNKKDPKNKDEDDITASKIKTLSIIESNFSTTNLNKLYTPSLKKLKIKRTILPLTLAGYFDSLLYKSSFLQSLYLKKCFIDDEALSQFFIYLSEKPKLLESLQIMSFSGNEISSVNFESLIEKKCNFKSLEVLDFSKNNIFEFAISNFKLLQNIKILDLTDNNLTNYTFFENIKSQKNIKCILFLCNNLFLTNNKNNTHKYITYINDKLGKYNSKIKKINLSFMYDKTSKPILLKLKLSPMIKISLIKLNLAYCGLDSEVVCNFLNHNFGLLNLKILNLCNNLIELKFFQLIKNVDLSLEKLSCLDLSLNDIHSLTYDDYLNIELFVNKHPNLKKIKMQETIFLQDLLILNQNEPDKAGDINKNLINKEFKFVVEKDNTLMIEQFKELFEIKDKEV